MATTKQRDAAKRNIKKAQSSAKEKETLKHLPKATRSELGKQVNKVKREKLKS